MPTLDRASVLTEYEQHNKDVAAMKEKQVMVFEGDLVEVELTDKPVQKVEENGYTFYCYTVKQSGKEKILRLFLNQAGEMEKVAKEKDSSQISIRRPKGSKKLEFS